MHSHFATVKYTNIGKYLVVILAQAAGGNIGGAFILRLIMDFYKRVLLVAMAITLLTSQFGPPYAAVASRIHQSKHSESFQPSPLFAKGQTCQLPRACKNVEIVVGNSRV